MTDGTRYGDRCSKAVGTAASIATDGSNRSALRILRELGQSVGIKVCCHALRHSSITTAIEKGQQAGVGLDQIRHFSRHRTLATMLIYRDEHDRAIEDG